MTACVIGLEGHLPVDALVAWGAAAIVRGDVVRNSRSGASIPRDEIERVVADGHLSCFDAIDIDDNHADLPLLAVLVNLRSDYKTLFLVDTGRIGGLVGTGQWEGWQIYVFSGPAAFAGYADTAIQQVLHEVLYGETQSTLASLPPIRGALALAPDNPVLNALRVYLADDRAEMVKRFARASLREPAAQDEFETWLTALSNKTDDYELKYNDGIAQGGGVDIDAAAALFANLRSLTRPIERVVRDQYRFFQPIPAPRLHELRAASAELHFVPSVTGRSLGERVARYLTLRLLQQTLDGSPPRALANSPEVRSATARVIRPTPETTLLHKPLGEKERHAVFYSPESVRQVERSAELWFLGAISGLERDLTIELRLFPKLRVVVSAIDNGLGQPPEGVDVIRERGTFLRMPCIFSLVRESDEAGHGRFWLQTMKLLIPGQAGVVSAVPSSVVDGAFVTDVRLEVSFDGESVQVSPLGVIPRAGDGTLPSVRAFLMAYAKMSMDSELSGASGMSRWIPPLRPQPPSALGRVVLALDALGGEAHQRDIVLQIHQQFGALVRTNNTRREVINCPDLLEFVAPDEQVIRLTEKGRRFCSVYRAAGGSVSAPPRSSTSRL